VPPSIFEPGGGNVAGSTGTGDSNALHQGGTSGGPPPTEAGLGWSPERGGESIDPTHAPSMAANATTRIVRSLHIVITCRGNHRGSIHHSDSDRTKA
jgi:hypothetical protein